MSPFINNQGPLRWYRDSGPRGDWLSRYVHPFADPDLETPVPRVDQLFNQRVDQEVNRSLRWALRSHPLATEVTREVLEELCS